MGTVVVAGSANLDTAVQVQVHPRPGETVLGSPIDVGAGGKGLNQAIAAARSGATTLFVGAVGPDPAAEVIRASLEAAGASAFLGVSAAPTGSAYVMVSPTGENAIVVVPGANADAGAMSAQLTSVTSGMGDADVLLTQLEIPLDVAAHAMRSAKERGATTILNAAPSRHLPPELLAATEILVVNEHECAEIAGPAWSGPEEGALALSTLVATVVVTLGAEGALVARNGEIERFAAYSVVAVDTTAAGDTFCGAMSAELTRGATLPEAIRFGMAAAALTVQQLGASESIPHREEILAFLSRT